MTAIDFDAFWNFSDPAGTEAKFRAARDEVSAEGDLTRLLELDTQIARTYSLRKRFDDAYAVLAEVHAALNPATTRAEIRYNLEYGRALRSSGKPAEARPYFETAVKIAEAAGEDALAIDAHHMVALVEPDPETQITIMQASLAVAAASTSPKAQNWQASLWNNIGMSYHDLGRLDDALTAFQTALAFREKMDNPENTRIARWMIAWTWRLQGRLQDALATQHELEPNASGYTFEELAELYLALGDDEKSKKYFARAWPLLEDDHAGSDRLARMKRLAGA
jgi:tetratricopeptide (TPR) repeat protein